MRPSSPAVYACRKSKNRGMHRWRREGADAVCTFCGISVTGEDADDVFRGAPTPIGQVRR